MSILKVDRGTKIERENVLNIRVKFPLRKRTLDYASYFAEVGLINIQDCHILDLAPRAINPRRLREILRRRATR